jgi:DNA-binding transcriptional MerR regulator
MNTSNQLSIRDAAMATGLSPSVIRVWEDRYGWPSPRRHRNGYRSFTRHEVEQLKRVATLVKAGTPISALIVDGFPQFPVDHSRPPMPRQKIITARTLPGASDAVSASLRDALCRALEDRHTGHVLETIQRAQLELRPSDELRAVLLPTLVGIAELHQQHYTLSDEGTLIAMVRARCAQLGRRFPTHGDPVILYASSEADDGLAQAVTALLAVRDIPSRTTSDAGEAQVVVAMTPPAGTRDPHRIVLTPLPCEGCIPVVQLLNDEHPRDSLLKIAIPALSVH